MTVLASDPERNRPAQDNLFPFDVDATLTRLLLTLTHPDWPEGECIRLQVFWGAVPGGQFSSGGGLVRDKAGNPTGGTKVLTWETNKPRDVVEGVLHIEIMQALRTAYLVEGF